MRNLATALIQHENIITTHAKAKETQVFVEHLITKAKRLAPKAATNRAEYDLVFKRLNSKVYEPEKTIPKLLHILAQRYAEHSGGYTRVLKLENRLGDCAPQSIIELIGGPRDMRAAMTARVVARYEREGAPLNTVTKTNVTKICRDEEATARFKELVEEMKVAFYSDAQLAELPPLVPDVAPLRAKVKLVENPLNASSQ